MFFLICIFVQNLLQTSLFCCLKANYMQNIDKDEAWSVSPIAGVILFKT